MRRYKRRSGKLENHRLLGKAFSKRLYGFKIPRGAKDLYAMLTLRSRGLPKLQGLTVGYWSHRYLARQLEVSRSCVLRSAAALRKVGMLTWVNLKRVNTNVNQRHVWSTNFYVLDADVFRLPAEAIEEYLQVNAAENLVVVRHSRQNAGKKTPSGAKKATFNRGEKSYLQGGEKGYLQPPNDRGEKSYNRVLNYVQQETSNKSEKYVVSHAASLAWPSPPHHDLATTTAPPPDCAPPPSPNIEACISESPTHAQNDAQGLTGASPGPDQGGVHPSPPSDPPTPLRSNGTPVQKLYIPKVDSAGMESEDPGYEPRKIKRVSRGATDRRDYKPVKILWQYWKARMIDRFGAMPMSEDPVCPDFKHLENVYRHCEKNLDTAKSMIDVLMMDWNAVRGKNRFIKDKDVPSTYILDTLRTELGYAVATKNGVTNGGVHRTSTWAAAQPGESKYARDARLLRERAERFTKQNGEGGG